MQKETLNILIVGGYGTFGGWLARLLSDEPGVTLLVAGRDVARARAFIQRHRQTANMIPVAFDRDGDLHEQLAALGAQYVVDASGPFQAYSNHSYRVARAALACGAHYLDIADSSRFVQNIAELDELAVAKGCFAISGLSTCVALSFAVYRHLARQFVSVESVIGGIAPSPRSGLGHSVMQAVALSAGKPVDAIRDGATMSVYPFTESKRKTVAPPGAVPLGPRRFSLVDVPDLALAGQVFPGVRETWFGAAPTPAVYHAVLRLLARVVRKGWLRSLRFLAPLMYKVMHYGKWGEHRGGMFIELRGKSPSGEDRTAAWHLVAEGDHGPAIPAMACAALLRRCIRNRPPPPGARPATHELELADFEEFFRPMNIRAGERLAAEKDAAPLFRRVLNRAWLDLPPRIRELHEVTGVRTFCGRGQVSRGRSLLARGIGRAMGFPPALSDVPVTVTMERRDDGEHWRRDFDSHGFSSVMSAGSGGFENLVRERFGAMKFAMALVLTSGELHYVPRGWTWLGIPMPAFLMPRGRMCEFVEHDRFHFHVEICMPLIGPVVTYQGWLAATRER